MQEMITAAGRAAIVVERGFQGLGRRSLAKAMAWTEREARSALEWLRANSIPSKLPSADIPAPIDTSITTPPTASFAKREHITELSNWRAGWVHEQRDPIIETETDHKGNKRTKKVIHDPGIVWPQDWQGPKSHAELMVEVPAPRPIKWGMLITAHQSQTPLHGPALMAMSALCGYGGLSLVVIGMEGDSPRAVSKTDEIADWSASIADYVTTDRHDFGDIVVDGAFPLKTTLEAPLHGLAAYCDGRNHVFGSTRQDMITLARFEGDATAEARCSGAVTVPNYSRSKAGMVAISNHVIGGLIVQCDFDGNVFTRNIVCHPVTGELWDAGFDVVVENGVVRHRPTVIAERKLKRSVLNLGCVHARLANKGCLRAIYGIDGRPGDDLPLVDVLDPSEQILHDVFDAHSVGPHNSKDPIKKLRKRLKGDDDVAAELKLTADLIEAIGSDRRRTWIVESNHDRHFDRFLLTTDWKNDLKNAETFLRVNLAQIEAVKAGDERFSALSYALRLANPNVDFETSRIDEPLRFFRYYYHLHGDKGTNGGTGSTANFVGTGLRLALAHDHSPGMYRGVMRIGCIIDTPDHVKGLTSIGHAVGVEHPDGSYQLIPIMNGKWRP